MACLPGCFLFWFVWLLSSGSRKDCLSTLTPVWSCLVHRMVLVSGSVINKFRCWQKFFKNLGQREAGLGSLTMCLQWICIFRRLVISCCLQLSVLILVHSFFSVLISLLFLVAISLRYYYRFVETQGHAFRKLSSSRHQLLF
jgi:hypothetical protein